jgi:hypothetical protein
MSLRKSLAGSSAALALATGLLVSAAPEAPAAPHYKPWGSVRAPDQVLRDGCHRYRFHYRMNPPTNSWAAEFFLVNPNGHGLTSTAILTESDPAKGWKKFTICRASTVYGRHKIRMKVTYDPQPSDPTSDNVDGWVKPGFFRLTRP